MTNDIFYVFQHTRGSKLGLSIIIYKKMLLWYYFL